jgi:hypothetical protein
MKYPKLISKWKPAYSSPDVNILKQIVRVYKNSELIIEDEHPYYTDSIEFFVPAWDEKGNLLEETSVMVTIQAISDNFHSEAISSNIIELTSIAIESPSEVEIEMLPFPEFFEDVEIPVVVGSGIV